MNCDVEAWSAIGSVASALIAAIAAGLSAYSAVQSNIVARREALSGQMQIYLDAYAREADLMCKAHNVTNYGELSDAEQARVRVVSGLLVGVLDSMKLARDPRYKIWLPFLDNLKGPLLDENAWSLSDFAESDELKGEIVQRRSRHAAPA